MFGDGEDDSRKQSETTYSPDVPNGDPWEMSTCQLGMSGRISFRGIENMTEIALDDFNMVVFAAGDDVGMSNGQDSGRIEIP